MTRNLLSGICLLLSLTAAAAEFSPDVRPGAGVTEQRLLSDYFAPLADTAMDSEVFVLDSGVPGAVGLMIGGTHGNELAGQVAALLAVENVTAIRGKLVVIPYVNRSAMSMPDSRNAVTRHHRIESRSGERYLPYGDRRTDPADQGVPDPGRYTNPPGYTLENGAESRNLNRTYPGKADGTPTERLAWAVMQLVRAEAIDFALDMHEADTPERKPTGEADYRPGGNKRLAYTLVAHPRGLETAAFALLEMDADTGISMKLEESNSTYRGLSHIEIGDNSPAVSFLSESPNPGQDRWRDDPDVVSDTRYPLTHRAGLHLRLFKHLADAHGEATGKRLEMTGIPEYEELMAGPIGRFLN
ncbi:MAG: succinylglutamate desuccinylase/aspartoacylase family protein [Gammaproteobacteria bacterium]|nr:succinylglutamate desuccinylase/aspartoacylase family protein [Gammaproteobacteria bacterium]